ncbi:MAG: translation initiation factor IF-2 [Elusimicrobiales bacterium]|nr:translation initiation factor IF-2 [Elusimicrobiales bacterium]
MSEDNKIKKKSIDEIKGKKKTKVEIDKNKAKAFLEKLKAKQQTSLNQIQQNQQEELQKDNKGQDLTNLVKEGNNIKSTTNKSTKAISSDKKLINESIKKDKETTNIKSDTSKQQQIDAMIEAVKEKSSIPSEEGFVTYEIKDQKPTKIKNQEHKKKDIKQEKTSSSQNITKQDVIKKEAVVSSDKDNISKIEKKEGIEYKKLKVSTSLTVRDLAEKLGISPVDLIKKLMGYGIFASITQKLEEDVAALISLEYGYELEFVPMFEDTAITDEEEKDEPTKLKPRPPIITIMGHVDHGKTTLLDALRESNVVDTEAGQITQHIGAYMVRTSKGNITVLDTPGHEAFTAMRAQGVKITDIVVLVVSAVDGVMPQTIEAINHAKAANVPIIVAINKIDLPQANPNQIKQQLASYEIIPEDWGGKVPMVEISAKKKLNIDKLVDIILLQAEIMELKSNYEAKGTAVVVEAKKDSKRGVVATVVATRGKIKIGDSFVVGTDFGKVRALINDRGERLTEITPGIPAEILGINEEIPVPGDILKVVESEKIARQIAQDRKQLRKDNILHQKNISLLSLKSQLDQKIIKKLNIIIKTDVYGSLQAIRDSLEKFSNTEVAIHILHTGIGDITESDVLLAKASNAIIFGFNIKASDEVREKAKILGVEIRIYKIIYELFDEMKAAINGMLEPEIVDMVIGKAEIKQIFEISVGKVCGCMVIDGKITRNSSAKIIRNGDIIGEGKIVGLKRFKDDVKEVDKGYECGIMVDGFKNFEVGDIIEAYVKEERVRRIDEFQRG